MAILVVCRVDTTHPDPYINCQHYKRGDVVQVLPDDHTFSETEKKHPRLCFIPVPKIDPADLQGFVVPEQNADSFNPSRVLQRRGYKFDLDHPDLPQDIKTIAADPTRSAETAVLSKPPVFDPLTFRVKKAPLADPAVIG
jgi:hypothetical protein